MKSLLITLAFLCAYSVQAQIAYTVNNFDFYVDSNFSYGSAINFAGQSEELHLDIYKPVNTNCLRPCLILVHGGSWMAGSKENQYIVNMARDFAEKGWVVAAINYRLGMHKKNYHETYALCTPALADPCSYMADSSEIIRAIYRAQQDVKGAIRAMKMRNLLDSTDINNFFVAGESAGGFNSLAATFLNDPSEKFPQAFAIADAPTPDPDLVVCLPQGYSLSRPDLGDIDGTLNLGTYNATVQGVGNFYGALLNFDLFANETNWPEMYFFHQGSDVIVHYNYGRILGRLDWECFQQSNICQAYAVPPRAYGSKGIINYLNSLPSPPSYTASIIENFDYLNNCLSNGHSIDNWLVRSQEMADLFAQRIQVNGNTGNASNCAAGMNQLAVSMIQVVPNPSNGSFKLEGEPGTHYNAMIYTVSGQILSKFEFTHSKQLTLETGVYFILLNTEFGTGVKRVIIQ